VKETFRDDEGKRRIGYLIKEGDELIAVIRKEKEAREFVGKVREQQGV
jgi:hypothetical protein